MIAADGAKHPVNKENRSKPPVWCWNCWTNTEQFKQFKANEQAAVQSLMP
jgi:hypothetical protein